MRKSHKFFLLIPIFIVILLILSLAESIYAGEKKNSMPELGKNLRPGGQLIYSIKMNNELLGYTAYRIERTMQLAGQTFINFKSTAQMKIGLGSVQEMELSTDFSVAQGTLLPAYLSCLQKSSNENVSSEVVFSKGIIAQKNSVGENNSNSVLPIDKDCYLFFNNLWGRVDTFIEHYLLLIVLARSGMTKITVYDPILQTIGDISVEPLKEEQVDILGVKYQCRGYLLKDFYDIPFMYIWFEPKQGIIVRMREAGGGMTFELSNSKVVTEVKKAPGVDLWSFKSIHSPIYFSDPEKISSLQVEASFTGRGLLPPDHKVIGFDQTFAGDFSDTAISGKFKVTASKLEVKAPNPFPPKNIPQDLNVYLKYQAGIEKDNEYLKNKSMEITWKSGDVFTAASRINKWIKENIKTGVSLPSALFSLNNGIGNSESRAMLMVSMCRAVGIPARKVGGMAFKKGDFQPYHWVEVYIPDNGWASFDTEAQEEQLDAARIYLWEFGDIHTAQFANIDFEPKPPTRVTFYNKDLTWPVGEERTFSIRKGEQVIGEEIATVEDIIFEGDKETYILSSSTTLDIGGNTYKATGRLRMSPKALPIEFNFDSEVISKHEKQHFKFGDKYISQILDGENGDEEVRDIPYSQGTYLIDQRFLSQWALVIGQIPRPQLGKKYNFTVFIPEDLKCREIELEVKNFERIEVGGKEMDAFRCESKRGLVFFIDLNGKVVRIALPPQNLEVDLIKTAFDLKS